MEPEEQLHYVSQVFHETFSVLLYPLISYRHRVATSTLPGRAHLHSDQSSLDHTLDFHTNFKSTKIYSTWLHITNSLFWRLLTQCFK